MSLHRHTPREAQRPVEPARESCLPPTVRIENGGSGHGLPGDAGTVTTSGAGSGRGAYMQQGLGSDVTAAGVRRCADCAYLSEQTSAARPSEFARSHRLITLFYCGRVPGVPWSHLADACGSFVERAR